VCAYHAELKGYLLTYLPTYLPTIGSVCLLKESLHCSCRRRSMNT